MLYVPITESFNAIVSFALFFIVDLCEKSTNTVLSGTSFRKTNFSVLSKYIFWLILTQVHQTLTYGMPKSSLTWTTLIPTGKTITSPRPKVVWAFSILAVLADTETRPTY